MAVLGTEAERFISIRKLAGGIGTVTISDDDLRVIVQRNDNWMETQTNKFDWTNTNTKFETAITASNYMSSAEVLDGLPEVDVNKIESQRRSARDTIKAINRKDEIQGTAEELNVYLTAGHEQ